MVPLMWSLLLALSCSKSPEADAPPVVLVVIDTLRNDRLGFMGHTFPTSPNMDALAKEAAWFTRAYSASPWTLPATATLLTGEPPWEHRAVADPLDQERFGVLSALSRTVAEDYKSKGYRTGAWVNNPFLAPAYGLNQGFDVYDYSPVGPAHGYRSAQDTVAAALAWLSAEPGPSFAMIHMMEPHYNYRPMAGCKGRFTEGLPHTVEMPLTDETYVSWWSGEKVAPDDQAYAKGTYDEEICTADDGVGKLIAGLKAQGLWDDVWLVVTSDHGEEFWETNLFGHGHSMKSVLTQVPLLIKAPGVAAGRNDTVVGHVDVAALLRDRAGTLVDIARSGETVKGRFAASSNPNRIMDQLSLVTDDKRHTILTESNASMVESLDARGWEQAIIETQNTADAVRASETYTIALTFHDDPLKATLPSVFHQLDDVDEEQWRQLRTMGYVD